MGIDVVEPTSIKETQKMTIFPTPRMAGIQKLS